MENAVKQVPAYAVLLPLVRVNGQDRILLEVRAAHLHQAGEVCLPGGRMEQGETPAAAALREFEEELGIPASAVTLLGELPPDQTISHKSIAVLVGRLDENALPLLAPNPAEVAETFLLPLDWLRQNPPLHFLCNESGTFLPALPPILAGYLKNYSGIQEIWYWEYGRFGIWGLTARILRKFLVQTDSPQSDK